MSASSLDTLVSALSSQDVPCERTARSAFAETLADHLRAPAVGVPLDDLGASLADADVTVDPTPARLKAAQTGVTPASFAIADYGSVVIPDSSAGTELASLFVGRHGEAFRERGDSGIVATGPSATADMGELVRGAHGPSEVHVIVLEDDDE